MGWQVHGVWQVLGRLVSPREVSRILFEIHIGALKMQMGWQGLGGVGWWGLGGKFNGV